MNPAPHSFLIQLIRFLLAGAPAFALAVPLNYALVEWGGWSKPIAYAVVLFAQVSFNYWMCRWFVFPGAIKSRWHRDFPLFVAGILGIRMIDWSVYLLLIQRFEVYYLLAQIINVATFALLKFMFSKKLLSG